MATPKDEAGTQPAASASLTINTPTPETPDAAAASLSVVQPPTTEDKPAELTITSADQEKPNPAITTDNQAINGGNPSLVVPSAKPPAIHTPTGAAETPENETKLSSNTPENPNPANVAEVPGGMGPTWFDALLLAIRSTVVLSANVAQHFGGTPVVGQGAQNSAAKAKAIIQDALDRTKIALGPYNKDDLVPALPEAMKADAKIILGAMQDANLTPPTGEQGTVTDAIEALKQGIDPPKPEPAKPIPGDPNAPAEGVNLQASQVAEATKTLTDLAAQPPSLTSPQPPIVPASQLAAAQAAQAAQAEKARAAAAVGEAEKAKNAVLADPKAPEKRSLGSHSAG